MLGGAIKAILAGFIPFFALIAQNCERYDLDAVLISAQVKAESGFNPRAVSRAGAIGLMQIMPETAEWLGFEGDEELLFLPEVNVRLGCYYDAWLMRYWRRRGAEDGPLEALAMASYNAGPNRVRRAMRTEDWFEALPRETKGYVKRIFRYRAEYLWVVAQKLSRR